MMATTTALSRPRWNAERAFYGGMALAILAAVCLGFARSFFLRPWFPEVHVPPERYFLLHGTVFFAWFVLLVVQALLVSARRVDLHRTLGVLGGVLAALMVVVGVTGAIIAARRPGGFVDSPMPPLRFLAVPLFDMALFGTLVGLALAWRRDRQAHKRLMLVGSIALLIAAIARWPFAVIEAGGPPVVMGLNDLYLVPLVIWDLATCRRVHPATLWGGLALVASQPLRFMLSGTEAWLVFARWLTGLPG